jgi:hypothetical protein
VSWSTVDADVEAEREFKRYRDTLAHRLDRAAREATDAEYRKLRALWEAWGRAHRAWEQAGEPMPPGLVQVLVPPPPWEQLEDEFGPVEEADDGPEERLRARIAARIAAGRPTDRATGLTQNQIIEEFGVGRSKVQRLERELGSD